MKKIIDSHRRNMYLCLVMIPCSFGIIAVIGLEILDALGLGVLIMFAMIAFILLFWGIGGFFIRGVVG